jgi:hypothetical protein
MARRDELLGERDRVDPTGDRFQEIVVELGSLENQLINHKTALDLLANSNIVLADTQKRLAEIQARREGAERTLLDFTIADAKTRREMIVQLAAFNKFQQTGQLPRTGLGIQAVVKGLGQAQQRGLIGPEEAGRQRRNLAQAVIGRFEQTPAVRRARQQAALEDINERIEARKKANRELFRTGGGRAPRYVGGGQYLPSERTAGGQDITDLIRQREQIRRGNLVQGPAQRPGGLLDTAQGATVAEQRAIALAKVERERNEAAQRELAELKKQLAEELQDAAALERRTKILKAQSSVLKQLDTTLDKLSQAKIPSEIKLTATEPITLNVNFSGTEFLTDLSEDAKQVVQLAINEAINDHIDRNTGEMKVGPRPNPARPPGHGAR